MTQPDTETPGPAVGACIPCRSVFYVDGAGAHCPFCAGSPSYTLPFSIIGDIEDLFNLAVPADLPPVASAPPFGAPEAAAELEAAPAAAPGPEPAAPTEEPAIPDVPGPPPPPGGTVETYRDRLGEFAFEVHGFVLDEPPNPVRLRALMAALGAEEEEISTAVGRLDAVRNLIHDLAARGLGDVRPEPSE